jgi:hypothetical protein
MVMEHAETLEHIEIAAVEPGGLDRLMAGDTAISVAVAGHLAGCQACIDELSRIRRTSALARAAIRSQPDPALRDRTLAFVRTVGRDRGPRLPEATAPVPVATRRRSRWSWLAAAAAAVIGVGLGFAAGTIALQDDLARQDREVALLQETGEYAVAIAAQPDARQVALEPTPASPGSTGSILFSASTGELVAVAHELAPPGPDQEYGCWVEAAGQRQRLGRMYTAGDLWTWAGPAEGLGDLPPGAVFGVSIGPRGGGADSTPVLTGSL